MDAPKKRSPRNAISAETSVLVYRRDGWLCRYCHAPVILAQAMKYLERFVRAAGITEPLAYYHPNWTRTYAPLLDYLGAEVDHVKAHGKSGPHHADNFVTSCLKCNSGKSDTEAEDFRTKHPRRKVKSKYGEPLHWDGLSTLFMVLAERDPKAVNSSDRAWLRALRGKAE
jgi:5-methylcytosine-specific restriction endonuclease McrA